MGEVTGFLQVGDGRRRTHRPVPVRLRDWKEVYEDFPNDALQIAGRALHGLRHPVLQQRMPARQPDPRLERPRLPRSLAATRSTACTPRTTSPSSPAGCARRRASRRACSASTPTGDDQAGRGRDHRPGVRRRMGRAPPPDGQDRQAGRGRRLGTGRARRRPAAHARRSRRRRARARRPDRRPAALRHPRVQDGEAPHRSPARQMEAEGTEFRTNAIVGQNVDIDRPASPRTTRSCSPVARRRGATCRCPDAS